MAQLIGIKLSRFDATPWGFRLQGGKDFGSPLLIQKVNGGSPAEKAGLQAGDAVIRVNDAEVFNLRHKDAQDYIVKAGNNFEITVERGAVGTWKPQVTPVGPAPVNYSPVTNVKPVTKTSLSAKKQDVPPVGSGYNFAPKPYGGPQVNGISDSTVKSIVNKQYNTPVGIYSEETIAETLSAQAEVLAGGVLGVNFKKNEKIYNAANSEVLKMVQEIDSEPKEPEPEPSVGGSVTSPSATGLRHVVAPETKPTPTTPHDDPFKVLPPGQNICADCERLIVGVFVRIKDKNLHVECFKCATCGTSLKNVGYYNINNKLYCDIHAKLVARQNPPAPNLEPVTIPPGNQVPAGTISAALARAPVGPASNFTTAPSRAPASTYTPAPAPLSPGNLSPQPGTLGPLPFHPIDQHRMPENNFVTENNMKNIITALPALDIADSGNCLTEPIGTTASKAPRGGTTHVSAPRPVQAPSSLAGPKPFSTPSAPVTNPARPTPAGSIFVWPPSTSEEATCPTATPLYVPPNPHQPASSSIMSTGKAATRIPLASVKSPPATASASAPVLTSSAQDRAAACPSSPTSVLTIDPECPHPPFSGSAVTPDTTPIPFQVTQTGSTQQTAPFPQPFSAYLAKHLTPLRAVASPTPIQQGHSQPLDELPPVQTVLQSLAHETNAISVEDSQAEDLQALKNAGLQKKFSLCSQEVFTINVDKPAPKFEALSETLETQMLGSSLTPGSVKRPGSPVPMQDSKTSSLQELDFTAVQETSRQAASEQDAQVKAVVTEISTLEAPNPVTESVPSPADRKLSVPLEIQSTSHAESTQPTGITNIETRQVSCTSESQNVSVTEQSILSQQNSVQVSEVRSCNQIAIETQEVQSQFVSELTASNGPYVPSPVSAFCSQSEGISKSGENMLSQSQTISSEAVSGFVPVSREQEYSATQFQQQTRHLSSQHSSFLISESNQLLKTFVNDQPTSQLLPSQAQDPTIANPSTLLSALTTAPDCTSSPLPPVLEPVVPFPTQSAPTTIQAAYSAGVKPIASAPLPVSVKGPHSQEVACPSPLLSALTVASDRPYSPLPPATKPMTHFPVQSSPASTQAIKPVVPAPLQAGIQAPLARGAAYPSVKKPASLPSAPVPLPTNTVAPLNPEDACHSPLTLALTIAPDRPYSPLSSSARSPGFMPMQTTARPAPATAPAAIKFLPSGVKAPFTELPLRDETQLPLISAPSQQITAVYEPQHVPTRDTPIQRPVSSGPLPVIGAFRPIIPQTEFKPISSSLVSDKEPHLSFRPVSEEFKTESLVSAPARPKTPVQRVATPTSRSRSGTPFQQQKYTTTGLQKPAIIPLYQQQMGDSPGQRPRSATPTCPMTVPRTQTPQPSCTKAEVPYAPQKPSASFHRQPPPQKPYASYQPVACDAPPTAVQSQLSAQQPVIPFPNIPLPADFKSECQALPFRPLTFSSSQPCFTPQQEPLGLSPQSAPLPAPSDPIFQFPLAAPQPTVPALVAKLSLLAGSQSVSVAPEPPISTTVPVVPVSATQPVSIAKTPSAPSSSSVPNAGGSGVGVPGWSQKGASIAGSTAPRRGRGVLTHQTAIAGGRIALCAHCKSQIRGPFITALGKNWCPDHFVCVNAQCRRPLADIGFVEEKGELYCEYCFEKYLAPTCDKCSTKIKGDCLNAISKHFHPECFLCAYCGKLFGNNPFFLEDGLPYCEDDWNELFTTKCFACGFPIEAGDRWVEALSNNYHSQCFNCTNCKKNLEGQSFYAKGGRPFCKAHAR